MSIKRGKRERGERKKKRNQYEWRKGERVVFKWKRVQGMEGWERWDGEMKLPGMDGVLVFTPRKEIGWETKSRKEEEEGGKKGVFFTNIKTMDGGRERNELQIFISFSQKNESSARAMCVRYLDEGEREREKMKGRKRERGWWIRRGTERGEMRRRKKWIDFSGVFIIPPFWLREIERKRERQKEREEWVKMQNRSKCLMPWWGNDNEREWSDRKLYSVCWWVGEDLLSKAKE